MAIDTKKVAIDLEYIRERDDSLLKNVRIPDSQYGPWENFYLQWCAKECVIKFLDINSKEMSEMSVMAFLREQHFIANDWSFDSIVLIHYR
jgi:phosphopantetheinyl transferase